MLWRRGAVLIAAVAVASLLGACKSPSKVSSFSPPTTARVAPKSLPRTEPAPLPGIPAATPIALAALATGPVVHVFPSPGAAVATMALTNPTLEAQQLALLAVDKKDDWYQVRMPERPNNVTGWVRASEVSVTPVENRIVVSLGQKSLRVLDKNQAVIYETNVAVGKPRTPTPLGRFYVDIVVKNPGSPYGAYMLSIAGFSDVLKSFGGGRGQIALHGWSDPSVMGRDVSNGCIRMRNADITHLATLAPLGTPVEVIG